MAFLALGFSQSEASQATRADRYTPDEIQAAVMGFSDSWADQIAEATYRLESRVGTVEASNHMDRLRLYSNMAMIDIAASPNPGLSMLDMVVLVTLTRMVWEEYWGPEVYGAAAQPLIAVLRRLEAGAWSFAATVLTPVQLNALREAIREWRRRNPEKTTVNFIRFGDFAALGQTPSLEAAIRPGGPLGPVREAAEAAEEIRAMGDRALFLTLRMPELVSQRLEMSVKSLLRTPELAQVLGDIHGFRISSERYAKLMETLPAQVSLQTRATVNPVLETISHEREMAIEQALKGIAQERQAILEQLVQAVDEQRGAILSEVLGSVDRQRQALTGDVAMLLERSEQEAEAMLTDIFVFSAALVLLIFLLRLIACQLGQPGPGGWVGRAGAGLLMVLVAVGVIAAAYGFVRVTFVPSLQIPLQSSGREVSALSEPAAGRIVAETEDGAAMGASPALSDMAGEVRPPALPAESAPPGREPMTRPDAVESDEVPAAESRGSEKRAQDAEPTDLPPAQEGTITIPSLFPSGSAALIPTRQGELDRVLARIREQPVIRVEITGYTDDRGPPDYNVDLSQRRAEAVATYLVDRGIDRSILVSRGDGPASPIAPNDTPEGRARNRRVEITIVRP
jgi:outer membrane protein OmpA-like peptidoglycan-associated protein